MSDPTNEPSCEQICELTNDQTTNEVRPSSTSNTSYTFEAVNGINTSYMFEADNGVIIAFDHIKLFKLSELIVKYPILIVRINGISGHNLVNRIFETSNAFNCQLLSITFIKTNANSPFPLCNDQIIYLEATPAA
jgi:hypothetical protein